MQNGLHTKIVPAQGQQQVCLQGKKEEHLKNTNLYYKTKCINKGDVVHHNTWCINNDKTSASTSNRLCANLNWLVCSHTAPAQLAHSTCFAHAPLTHVSPTAPTLLLHHAHPAPTQLSCSTEALAVPP